MGIYCANPKEGPVQRDDGNWYCAVEGESAIGWGDQIFVICHGTPETCAILAAIARNHALSTKNTNYKGHLASHTGQASADDPGSAFTTRVIRKKR